MIDTTSENTKRKMPGWLIAVFVISTFIFIGFMILMMAMLSTERG
jgi:hypothetical protein